MKISQILLTTLLAASVIGVQAQTKPVKQKPKKATKTEPKKVTPKPVVVKSTRPITTDYCPPCGRG